MAWIVPGPEDVAVQGGMVLMVPALAGTGARMAKTGDAALDAGPFLMAARWAPGRGGVIRVRGGVAERLPGPDRSHSAASLREISKKIHQLERSGIGRNKHTIAVLTTSEGKLIIASSRGTLTAAQRRAAEELGAIIVETKNKAHAERLAVKAAKDGKLTPLRIAPSRPACSKKGGNCREFLNQENIEIVDP